MNFDEAFEKLIGHEGGYVNNKSDPGGETKYGISKRSYPHEDIAGMTLDRAKALYARDFWQASGCDALPDELRFHVFDMAVNAGVRAAVTTLQRVCGAEPDGIFGPLSKKAVAGIPAMTLVAWFSGARLAHMTSLKTWPLFGRGWTSRVAQNLMQA